MCMSRESFCVKLKGYCVFRRVGGFSVCYLFEGYPGSAHLGTGVR